jgi:hypothetical protein
MIRRLAMALAFASILSRTPATTRLAPPPATQYSIPIVGMVASAEAERGLSGSRDGGRRMTEQQGKEWRMTEPESEIDAQVTELISKKIAADDADSGWVVAYAAMRVLPVLKDIAAQLYIVETKSPQIVDQLRRMADLFEKQMGEG